VTTAIDFETVSLRFSIELLSDVAGQFLTTKNTDFRLGTVFALARFMPKTYSIPVT